MDRSELNRLVAESQQRVIAKRAEMASQSEISIDSDWRAEMEGDSERSRIEARMLRIELTAEPTCVVCGPIMAESVKVHRAYGHKVVIGVGS